MPIAAPGGRRRSMHRAADRLRRARAGPRPGRAAARATSSGPSRCRSRPRPASSTTPASSRGSWTPAWRRPTGPASRQRKAQAAGRGQAARHRHVLLHRIRPWATRPSTPAIEFDGRRQGHGAGRHPDQRPGPRDRLRPGAAPAPERAVREDPHRPGRHRPDQGRRRHRRLALADRAGHGDQRRVATS